MENLSGTNVKGYELRERIGAGGFGAVYKAFQSTVGREVAVKIILPGFANQPDFIRRFETEAQLVARLEHPHITPLYDYWRDPDGAYLVMRWLRGGSLRGALQNGPFDLHSTALLLDQIGGALSLAHRSSVIHRDLKPANILLDEDGNAYLADFGIAKDLGNRMGEQTQADAIVGSPDYLSPEQARSEAVTPRTDIYSLGVVLYEILTGEHPFKNLSVVERLYKHLNDPLPEITSLDPTVADAVNQLIQKATAKNPDLRYDDVLALVADFREAAGLNRTPNGQNMVEALTQREQEILRLIMDGLSNKEIAQKLTVTHGTVKWYVNQIYAKLGVRSRVQAIVRARELNLLGGEMLAPADSPSSVSLPAEVLNPYKGLRAFQTTDEQDFFGREEVVRKLVRRLGGDNVGARHALPLQTESEEARFLAIVGPSGSGKSSLVKAGLIPALWRGELPGSERWFVVEMLPGTHPLEKLEVALMRVAANQSGSINDQLRRDERGLLRVADLILPSEGELLLVVDQFEEVFTLAESEADRQHFLNLLRTATTDARSRVRVVITLRADFYDRPLQYAEFGDLMRNSMETVLPLSAKGLERAISGPAERVGAKFEPGLVAAIVAEMNYQSGALPLLQYALTELFEHREGRRLTQKAYQDIGGAIGALAKRADELYNELSPEGQEAARQMFLRLVTVGDGGNDTRRRTPRSELLAIAVTPHPKQAEFASLSQTSGERDLNDTSSPLYPEGGRGAGGEGVKADLIDDVIDAYAAHRLLTLDNDPASRAPTVELAHEAILSEWARLRAWLDDSREDIRLQRQLATMASEWNAANRDRSFLLHGGRLSLFEQWAAGTTLALTPAERTFVDASVSERERQAAAEKQRQERESRLERRSGTFLRALVVVLLLATLGAFGLTATAINQSNIAMTAQANAESAQRESDRQARIAQARELAGYAVSNLDGNAELSALLAIQAVNRTYSTDGFVLPEAETVLHQALEGLHPPLRIVSHSEGAPIVNGPGFSSDGTVMFGIMNICFCGPEADARTEVLDAATGRFLYSVPGTGWGPIWNDHQRLMTTWLSADRSEIVDRWDVTSGQVGQPIATFTIPIATEDENWTDTTADFHYSIVTDTNNMTRVWDMTTGQEIFPPRITSIRNFNPEPTFSPDGTYLGIINPDGTESVLDTSTWEEVFKTSLERATDTFRFSGDGQYLLTINPGSAITVWNIATGEPTYTLTPPTTPTSIAMSTDGTRLAAGMRSGQIIVWELPSGKQLFSLTGSGPIGWIDLSPDGERLAANMQDQTESLVWDLRGISVNQELLTVVTGEPVSVKGVSVSYSPDGHRFVTTDNDPTPIVWDAETGQQLFTLLGHSDIVHAAAWSPDGKWIATASQDTTVKLWDAATGQVVRTLTGHSKNVNRVAFSPDSTRLLTSSDDLTAKLWDVSDPRSPDGGQLLLTLSGHNGPVVGLTFSPDGRRLATASNDRTARVWDAVTGDLLHVFSGHHAEVRGMAFSPDGRRIVTSSWDQTAIVWDAQTGQALMTLSGHSAPVTDAAYSPDGTRIVTASLDGTAQFWDATTGEPLLTLYGAANGIYRFAFSPDGTRLATANEDGTARVFLLPVPDVIALAQSRLTHALTDAECKRYLHVDTCPPQAAPDAEVTPS